ncbi:uncharacterized protein VTP21DRAFT_3511 [Calcarisporiella thermophila]|uniref:uncharacterized protein n=1 Tax=Calcarisporiella thermophila TaxID=911321 RepID=UPI0037427BA1
MPTLSEQLLLIPRSLVFWPWGYRAFTAAGYEAHMKDFNKHALNVDLNGWSCVVTGANSGLGRQTVLELVKRGAKVHMLCRNAERGELARRDVLEKVGKETNDGIIDENCVLLHVVDVGNPADLKQFVDKLHASNETIDVLINNAGILPGERIETVHGIEQTFAINTLGTYYLTVLLVPLLQVSGRGRVVTVSSGGAYMLKLDTEDVEFKKEKFSGYLAYANSKRAQIELTEYWATKYGSTGVRFYSMHPGWADTPGVKTSMRSFYERFSQKFRTPAQGADTIVWAAISKEAEAIPNGSFLFDRKPTSPHLRFLGTKSSPQKLEQLIKYCDELIAKSSSV